MTRLTPWGLVHHIPVFISKRRHPDLINPETESMASQSKKKKNVLIPWFFRSRNNRRDNEKIYTSTDVKEAIMTKMLVRNKLEEPGKLSRVDTSELMLLNSNKKSPTTPLTNYNNVLYRAPQIPSNSATPPPLPPRHSASGSSMSDDIVNIPINDGHPSSNDRATIELMNRVEELEIILSEYFINTDYLDQLRNRRNNLSSSPTETIKDLEERNY